MKRVNVVQRAVLAATGLAAATMVLNPPFSFRYPTGVVENLGYHLILDPPNNRNGITAPVDAATLLAQLAGLLVVGAAAFLLTIKNEP